MVLYNTRRKNVAGGTITKRSIATATISGVSNSYTYTGEAIAPTPTVRLGDTLLTATEDYTVSYADNTAVGLATVTITGVGNYYGTATATFYITSAAPSGGDWAFDVSDIPSTVSFTEVVDTGYLGQICPSSDGGKLLLATGSGFVRVGTISDFSPETFSQTGITNDVVGAKGILYTPDGIHYLVGEGSSHYIYIRTASSAYDVSTIPTTGGTSIYESSYIFSGGSISADGRHVLLSISNGQVWSYDLSTEWDLTSATNKKTLGNNGYAGALFANPSGKQFVLLASAARKIVLFSLSTAWDASSATLDGATSTLTWSPSLTEAVGIAVNASGTKMLISGYRNGSSKGYLGLVSFTA